ncbi:MAG: response regulator [Bdellovibrionales bacterium]|nr:response regulator [Bdellovibrionales bacterium]
MNRENLESASILVVDDNPLITNVLNSLFKAENYRVYTSTNGKEALDVLDKKNVDVIVCDVMMPQMGGYELHERIRKNPEFSHIPFVFLTALSEEDEIYSGKSSGADDYVVKPFDPKALIAMIKGKVNRSKNLKNLSDERYESYRKRVIHTLSHEFRTPLVAINTGTELLLEQNNGVVDDKIRNLLEAIQRGGMRLERLVNDFMLLQQIEAGIAKRVFDSRAKVIPVDSIAEHVFEWIEQETLERGFKVKSNFRSSGINVFVYAEQIEDILRRLVHNAVKFSFDRKAIEFCTYRLDQEVALEIRDRGIGLDAERVKEAIDVFGQIDRDKLEQQGGGLGLAIAGRYANINSGRLEFENREDGGAAVSLVLPIYKPKK